MNSAKRGLNKRMFSDIKQDSVDKFLRIKLFLEETEQMEPAPPTIPSDFYNALKASVYKGYKRDKIEMRGDRAEMSDFPLYLNTVAGGLDRRDQTIGGFSFVVKIYAVPVVEIIG